MRLRSLRIALSISALVLTGLVTLASPASAAPEALVCAVAGTVDVSPGAGRIPPGDGTPSGTYDFDEVALVCVGANAAPTGAPMTGVNHADSTGSTSFGACGGFNYPLIGSFCGSYNAANDPLLGLPGNCAGRVGGPEAAGLDPNGSQPGNALTAIDNVANGNWSVTFGPLILGGITCTGGSYAGSEGVIALVAVPMPTHIDSTLGPVTSDCADPNPLPEDPSGVGVWFCQIAIAGVAVIAQA